MASSSKGGARIYFFLLSFRFFLVLYCVQMIVPFNPRIYNENRGEKNGWFPKGEKGEGNLKYGDMTPLQKHVAFFDRNKDGLIYPWETFQGMRAIGAGIGLSTVAAMFINGALGPKTRPQGKFPSLLFPIYVENISKGKHGSDSGAYDSEGRFVPEKFEDIFKKYAKTKPDALTSKELDELLQGNKEPKDANGHFAAKTEWKVLYLLAKDKDGFLSKDTIRGVFDGSLFLKLEQERSSSQKK